MSNISRRGILGLIASAWVVAISSNVAFGKSPKSRRKKIPVLHATDLFRPHMDPDDHWDLACVYALAHLGEIDLKAVVIDFPPKNRDPDVAAIAQLNYTIDVNAPTTDFADLNPENIAIQDDTPVSLSVTPKPGVVGAAECVDAGDCDDGNVCTDDAC